MTIGIFNLAKWDRATAWLHFGLAITITIQLFLSLWMEPPKTDNDFGLPQQLFITHKYMGMLALFIVVLHWFWCAYAQNAQKLRRLFPTEQRDWQIIFADIRGLFRLRLPATGPVTGLPGFIEGLGLIAVTIMACTGGLDFIFYPGAGLIKQLVHNAMRAHVFISTFVWIYWFGHVSMAVLHYYTDKKLNPAGAR